MHVPVHVEFFRQLTRVIKSQAVAFVSSAYSGGIVEILTEFRQPEIVGVLGVSLFVLGFAVGPLVWAPMSGEWLPSDYPIWDFQVC